MKMTMMRMEDDETKEKQQKNRLIIIKFGFVHRTKTIKIKFQL